MNQQLDLYFIDTKNIGDSLRMTLCSEEAGQQTLDSLIPQLKTHFGQFFDMNSQNIRINSQSGQNNKRPISYFANFFPFYVTRQFNITLRDSNGKTTNLIAGEGIPLSSLVNQFKANANFLWQWPESFELLFQGVPLNLNKSLKDHDIKSGSIIDCSKPLFLIRFKLFVNENEAIQCENCGHDKIRSLLPICFCIAPAFHSSFVFKCNDQTLSLDSTFADNKISDESEIHCQTSPEKRQEVIKETDFDFCLTVKTLTGQSLKFYTSGINPVKKIKETVLNLTGVPVDQMRLLYKGRQLSDEDIVWKLAKSAEMTWHMVLRLRGGGCAPNPGINFIDPTQSQPTKLSFSNSAPDWRKVESGLNLEGICKNKDCVAFKKGVICPIRASIFDLEIDNELVVCPMCNAKFVPLTCGFYNCRYKFLGLKKQKDRLVRVDTPWEKASDEDFTYFSPDEGKTAKWNNLKILTGSIFDTRNEIPAKGCLICLMIDLKISACSFCGNNYHDFCKEAIGLKKENCLTCFFSKN